MNEKELAQKFVHYLSDMFDLYFEVGTMDIVGKSGKIVIAVEVKKHLNFKVIQQAYDNIRSCHYSYVAVPKSSADRNSFGMKICDKLGIGVLVYNDIYDSHGERVVEKVKPFFNRSPFVQYAKKLNANSWQKRAIPGAKDGETITAFSVTLEYLEIYVRRHPGCEIKNALKDIDHHYGSLSSAKSCIVGYIDSGVIKTIRREGNRLYYKN